jgi:predicted esterase
MQENHLMVTRTARYFTLGNVHDELEQVWFVCHGYGQLAPYFLKDFEVLNNGTRLIVAPEALSRFYLNGFSGRIGASWMTREDRQQEIDDYVRYLDAVYQDIFQRVGRSTVKVYVLGFSQGTSTVCRWLSRSSAKIDRLILWAGTLPPDLDLRAERMTLNQLKLCLVMGKQDEYANSSLLAQQQELLNKHAISYRLITFEGGHQLDAEVLRELAQGEQSSS